MAAASRSLGAASRPPASSRPFPLPRRSGNRAAKFRDPFPSLDLFSVRPFTTPRLRQTRSIQRCTNPYTFSASFEGDSPLLGCPAGPRFSVPRRDTPGRPQQVHGFSCGCLIPYGNRLSAAQNISAESLEFDFALAMLRSLPRANNVFDAQIPITARIIGINNANTRTPITSRIIPITPIPISAPIQPNPLIFTFSPFIVMSIFLNSLNVCGNTPSL